MAKKYYSASLGDNGIVDLVEERNAYERLSRDSNAAKKYFDEQDRYGRVLHLPIHSFWGWVTYSWDNRVGYQGAGFLWFGIKQPLIDREFDRWNIANEQPDLIIFSGDLFDKVAWAKNRDWTDLLTILSELKAPFGKFELVVEIGV